jgi:DNA ligase 1
MKLDKLFKLAVNGKTLEYTIEVEGNKYRTISGYTDGIKTITEWTVCEGKNIGKKNATTPEQQAMAEALAMQTKRLERGYFTSISDINTSTIFNPMLAQDWNKHVGKVYFPVYSQPKLDGIRCIVKNDGMWSRTGKPIVSAPHIFDSLKFLFENDPDLILDGELYADKFANDFNAIVSLVKKTKPTLKDLEDSAKVIQYHIYDLPSCDDVFTKRFQALQNMELPECCVKVKTDQIDNMNDLTAYYEDYMIAGYEGQMVRLDSYYESKRSKNLLKHKSFIDEEYIILGIQEGIGNKTGMVGSFIFETNQGKRFNASPKFSWEECKYIWDNKDNIIGSTATVKYFNLTPDGIPRFPVVIQYGRENWE